MSDERDDVAYDEIDPTPIGEGGWRPGRAFSLVVGVLIGLLIAFPVWKRERDRALGAAAQEAYAWKLLDDVADHLERQNRREQWRELMLLYAGVDSVNRTRGGVHLRSFTPAPPCTIAPRWESRDRYPHIDPRRAS